MMRSRLRRPTSKSITAVLWPSSASPDAKLALVVVLPTPPLPEVTTMILAIRFRVLSRTLSGFKRLDHQPFAIEPHLRSLAQHVGGQLGFGGAVEAGNRKQLRFHPARE